MPAKQLSGWPPGLMVGAAVWFLASIISYPAEPWDGGGYGLLYLMFLLGGGGVLGYHTTNSYAFNLLSMAVGQLLSGLVWMLFVGDMTPIFFFMPIAYAVYTLPAMPGIWLGKWYLRKTQSEEMSE